tara:strand:- start:5075 stop:6340 length:1266 start_codon:yes stop_codon:yes gene_type:complete
MDPKKPDIILINELNKNYKIYKLNTRKILIGNLLIFTGRLKKLFLRKNKFPILHAAMCAIIFSKPELKKYFLVRKFLGLFKRFSKYPYSLIYQNNPNLELRLISDKNIHSDKKNKILTDRISFLNSKETKVHKSLYPSDLSGHVFIFPGLVKNISYTKEFIKFLNSRNASIIFSIGNGCEIYLNEFKNLKDIYITNIENYKKYSEMIDILNEKKIFYLFPFLKLDCAFEKLKEIEKNRNKKFAYVHKLRVDMIYFQPHLLFSKEYIKWLDNDSNLITQGDLSFSGSRNTFNVFNKIANFFFDFFKKDPYSIDKINIEHLRNSNPDSFSWAGFAFSRKMLKAIGLSNPEFLSDKQLYNALSSFEFEKAQESQSYLLNSDDKADKYVRSPGTDMPPEIIFAKLLNSNNVKITTHDGILGKVMR